MALQTATVYASLGAGPLGLHGLRFRSLVSVDETARPPGGGVAPAVLGTVAPAGYVLDAPAGAIARAAGLDPIWIRVIYSFEDAPDPDQVDADLAGTQLAAERPSWKTLVQTALTRIGQGETQRQTDETASIADQAGLTAATTLALAKPFIQRLIDRERRGLDREQELYLFLERLIRAVAGQLVVSVPEQGLKK